jgi:hypothetical protein
MRGKRKKKLAARLGESRGAYRLLFRAAPDPTIIAKKVRRR